VLETLLQILSWNVISPTIMIEQDGDLGLNWFTSKGDSIDISISSNGMVNWAASWNGKSEHGTDLERVKQITQHISDKEFN
jgi:hypothetical protein